MGARRSFCPEQIRGVGRSDELIHLTSSCPQVNGEAGIQRFAMLVEDGPVVVGYDGSEGAAAALVFAIAGQWHSLSSTDRFSLASSEAKWGRSIVCPMAIPDFAWELKDAAFAHICEAEYIVRERAPQLEIQRRVVRARPHKALVEMSRDAAVLILGSGCRTSLSRIFADLSFSYCARKASCPVLGVEHSPNVAGLPNIVEQISI